MGPKNGWPYSPGISRVGSSDVREDIVERCTIDNLFGLTDNRIQRSGIISSI